MAKVIKNVDSTSHTYAGQLIAEGSSYTIQATEQLKWSSDDALLADIASGKAVVNDGISDIVGISNQINFLKDGDMSPRDSDGSPLQRTKITTTGWHYQLHGVEFETSKLDSIQSKKVDNSEYGFTTVKFYKLVNGAEVQIIGDDLNQTYLDSNCVKTVIDWEATHDLEIIGGLLRQQAVPTEDIRLWVVGVPDVSEAYGGSKPFAVNINLMYIGLEDGVRVDGRAPKYLAYNATYHTTKLRLILRHSAGFNHKLHMIFELFKA
jgi:hypothetical protein